ncbi:MAG TPA: hypothetical protein VFO59_04735 [Dehalococcoidia bacterium]|nr:hypothetical protein [Dehalococcoidia bacterium]
MSAEALPYTLLVLLAELTVGGLWVLLAAQWRGASAESFVKFSAAMVPVLAAIAFVVAVSLDAKEEIDGYAVDTSWADPARVALAAVLLLSLPYVVLTLRGDRVPAPGRAPAWALAAGGAASLAGLAALGFLAAEFSEPAWGFPLVLASMVVGALVLGAVSLGMVLGHWYLVTPRLPEQPLREMTFWLLAAMALQALLIIPGVALPHDTIKGSVDTPILENPFFYMRIGFGLAFPMLLAWMAYDSSRVRAMQSATGLLYIAMALVLAGELVGKGLMFTSAVPS